MDRRQTWTRPSLVRLSNSGSAEVGTISTAYEGAKLITTGGGYVYGSLPTS